MKDRTMITHDKNGNEMTVAVRSALPVDSPCARYTGFKQETLLLKKGSVRLKGYMPLPCDIILERDVPVTLRDGITIYTDIFRPNDNERHPAIMAMSPYGKEIGSQGWMTRQITQGFLWRSLQVYKNLRGLIQHIGAITATLSSTRMCGVPTIPRGLSSFSGVIMDGMALTSLNGRQSRIGVTAK